MLCAVGGSGCWWEFLAPRRCLDLPFWLRLCLHLSAEGHSTSASSLRMSPWSFAWPTGSIYCEPGFFLLHNLGQEVSQYLQPCLPTPTVESGFQLRLRPSLLPKWAERISAFLSCTREEKKMKKKGASLQRLPLMPGSYLHR